MKYLVTGAAGFIGSHVCQRLLAGGHDLVGLDNLNDYYDPALKIARLDQLKGHSNFSFCKVDLADRQAMDQVFESGQFQRVVHLAAQPGVRYSVENPHAYVESNLVGFLHVLEGCRHHRVEHLAYGSSSSVYGLNTRLPFSVHDTTDHPASLYAATKKCNEVMAHSYSHLYRLPTTGLRFFTVYGPWDRPDMGIFLFTRAIIEGRPIRVFNYGNMQRDFTYVDDIVEGIIRTVDQVATPAAAWASDAPDSATSSAPYRVYNIGSHRPCALLDVIETLERAIGKTTEKVMEPMQPGDVPATFADVDDLARDCGYRPDTPLQVGIERYVAWHKEFYRDVGPGAAGDVSGGVRGR